MLTLFNNKLKCKLFEVITLFRIYKTYDLNLLTLIICCSNIDIYIFIITSVTVVMFNNVFISYTASLHNEVNIETVTYIFLNSGRGGRGSLAWSSRNRSCSTRCLSCALTAIMPYELRNLLCNS